MRSKLVLSIACLVSCYNLPALAKDTAIWKGELYGIAPTSKKVTKEYCKSHAFDTYQTTAAMVNKEITADNGVKAKTLSYKVSQSGGIFFNTGIAMFSGIISGKPWQEKIHYFGQSLQASGGMQQGVWYSKDCKGFYKVGPV